MAWKPNYGTDVEAKGFVRINDAIDDTEIAIINAATSRAIDRSTNRQFGLCDAVEQRLYTPWFDEERWCWIIDCDDFQTTTGLVVTIAGTVTTDFTKEPVNAAQEGRPWTCLSINARTAATLPIGNDFEAAVTARWGWTTPPAEVPLAWRLQISRFLSRRDSPYGVAGSPDVGSEIRLLARLDPDVALLLGDVTRKRKPA